MCVDLIVPERPHTGLGILLIVLSSHCYGLWSSIFITIWKKPFDNFSKNVFSTDLCVVTKFLNTEYCIPRHLLRPIVHRLRWRYHGHHQARADDIISIDRRVKQHKIATQLGTYGECAQIIIFKMSYRILCGHCRCHVNQRKRSRQTIRHL